MLIKDLMTPCVSCVRPESTLSQAADRMKCENIGSLPVCNDAGNVLGIITDRDIVIRALSDGTVSRGIKIGDIMSTNIISVSPNMNTHDAALIMSKHQIRRLPVVMNNRLVGIISLADIARRTLYIDEAGDVLSAVSKPNGLS